MKIIRDKLVDVIDSEKLIIDDDPKQMSQFLLKKVHEELQEIIDSKMKDPYEYGDLIQVIFDLALVNGVSFEEIEDAKLEKLEDRGGFKNGVYLKDSK